MFLFNKISSQEKVDFAKNLAVMLKSGITINEALASLADQTKSKAFSEVIYKVKSEVETGTSLSESFAKPRTNRGLLRFLIPPALYSRLARGKEEKAFGKVFISILKAGEASGTLEENLSFLADWLERDHDLRQEIKAAMLYPKFVLTATFILGGGLSVYILPKLTPIFNQLRVELPLATRLLLAFSLFIEKFWYLALAGVIGIIVSFVLLNKIKFVKRIFHLIYIKMPFVKDLMISYQLALISQLFSALFKSGMAISEVLGITSEAATNISYQESIEKMKDRVGRGTTLSETMRDFPKLYPKSFVNIVATGEKSGTLDNSFAYLSEFYSKEVKNKTKKLPIIIEPALLVFIAIMVGFVALAIIMPIYELTSGLSQ